MQFRVQSLVLSGFVLAASAAAQTSTGQVCPGDAVSRFESCICPPDTNYQISTTYAILGVNAKDFYNYTASFYDLAWQGIPQVTPNGPNYKPGSTRTFSSPTPEGNLTFIEELDTFQSASDGSYVAKFSLFNAPIEYSTGNGSFSGYWITFDAEYAAQYETVLKWTNYACSTGYPFDYGTYHKSALEGLLQTMGRAGLVKGNTTGPYSVQSFP